MSFLFPLYLLGIAAVGIPIAMHLRRRRTRRHTPFSSLMFLTPTPPRARQRSRLENIVLLLLRCAVIALLALAFARPFFPTAAGAVDAPAGQRTVLLIDASGSMRRGDLWDQAVQRAKAALRDAGPGDRVAVFAFDQDVRQVIGFDEWAAISPAQRASMVGGRFDELSPGWGGTDLGAALVRAAGAIVDDEAGADHSAGVAGGEGGGGAGQVVLISDVQEGAELDALQGYEWPERVALKIEAVEAGPEAATNAGLQRVAERRMGRPPDSEGKDDGPRVRITNSADAQRAQFRLRWETADSSESPDSSARSGGDSAPEEIEVHVPPGGSRVIQAPPPPDAPVPLEAAAHHLLLTGDDHSFDNRLYLAPQPARPVRILYIGDGAEPTDASLPQQPLYYLRRALQPTRRRLPSITARTPAQPFEGIDLSEIGLVVLTAPLSPRSLEPLRAYLRSGRTVLLAMQSPEMAPALAALAGVERVDVSEAAVDDYAMLGQMDLEHPLLAPFNDPRFGDFTKIHFWRYRRIDADDLPGARVLARFDSGDPAWIEVPVGDGSLVVMASGWRPADSQLALSSKFVPLVYSILNQGIGQAGGDARFFVGDAVPIRSFASSPDATTRPLRIVKPDGSTVELPADREHFHATGVPGVYIMQRPGGDRRAFAVNVPPGEARTAPMPLDDLEQLGVRVGGPRLSPDQREERRRQARAAEVEERQQAWRWLALAAIGVLLAETALAGRLTPRSPDSP